MRLNRHIGYMDSEIWLFMTRELQLAGPGMLPPPARTGQQRAGVIQVGVDVADGAGRAGEQRRACASTTGWLSA